MLKKLFLGVGILLALILVAGLGTYLATSPERPAADSLAAHWLQSGMYEVVSQEWQVVDENRSTAANNEYPGADQRVLDNLVWYPADAQGARPLVIYSHGFMSNRSGGTYIAEALASHGYVVVAPNYPLTHGGAPGGPLVTDVVSQPGDISFLLDTLLAELGTTPIKVAGIDEQRIGVAGLSLTCHSWLTTSYMPDCSQWAAKESAAGRSGLVAR